MNILVINGPNLNFLGIREPEIYGHQSYQDLVEVLEARAQDLGVQLSIFQSNSEGQLIDAIQAAYGQAQAIIINAGAYTHTSIALLDALRSVGLPTVEVHLSQVDQREPYRQISYIGEYAEKNFSGQGLDSYLAALDYLYDKYHS